ncbi:hypothetical protein LLH00_16000 [bacterium]|nr:hypothetical protein [bacterium]
MSRETILKEYGEPLFSNEDVVVYITGPHQRFITTGYKRGKVAAGKMEQVSNGLIFFELQNNRVVFAGYTTLLYTRD